jgi:hypothetical protein
LGLLFLAKAAIFPMDDRGLFVMDDIRNTSPGVGYFFGFCRDLPIPAPLLSYVQNVLTRTLPEYGNGRFIRSV